MARTSHWGRPTSSGSKCPPSKRQRKGETTIRRGALEPHENRWLGLSEANLPAVNETLQVVHEHITMCTRWEDRHKTDRARGKVASHPPRMVADGLQVVSRRVRCQRMAITSI